MTPAEMVTSPANHAQGRQAMIDAACRVAMRMLSSGRGHLAALQFMVDVAARQFTTAAEIVGMGNMPSLACNENIVGDPPPMPSEVDRSAGSWSVPILTRQGTMLGELRLRAPESEKLDEAGAKALETIAHTAAEIITRSDGLRGAC